MTTEGFESTIAARVHGSADGAFFARAGRSVADSFSSRPDAALLPEVTADGLVLWRLRVPDHRLWCTVEDIAGQPLLRVFDPSTRQTVAHDTLDTAALVVQRADDLRDLFIASGWEQVDVDPGEPE